MQQWRNRVVEQRMVPLGELTAHPGNWRRHPPAQRRVLEELLGSVGFAGAVIWNKRTGRLIDGHLRVETARDSGEAELPAVVVDVDEDEERMLLASYDPLGAMAEPDTDAFRTLLDSFAGQGMDELLGDLAKSMDINLLGDGSRAGEDEIPEPPEEPVSKPGDLWILDNHRLLCGDATVLADVERVLGGQLADMTFCDPPYNVDYANTPKDKLRGKHRPILNDNLGGGFEAFLYDACVNILSVTKGAIYVCMSSSELDTLQHAFRAAGGKWSTFVIWAKNTFTLGRADYQRQYEPILYGWKEGSDHYWCGARDQGDVWLFDKPVKNDLHPTMKPVALVGQAVRNSSKTRDIVLDPFGGSGSTLIACEQARRHGRLIELDPKYVDVIIRRWQEWTGGTALLESGETFEEVAAARVQAAA